jgi:hypothetical protein
MPNILKLNVLDATVSGCNEFKRHGKKLILCSVQDVYRADINIHWPGSDITLACYCTKIWEVPLSTVHSMYFASCHTTVSLTWAQNEVLS